MGADPGDARSPRWEEVAARAESSRRDCREFEPGDADPAEPVRRGVAPLVRLYLDCCREGVELSAVERSLLEGALNDWLRAYAACRDLPGFEGTAFSVHEIALECARAGNVGNAVCQLFDRIE